MDKSQESQRWRKLGDHLKKAMLREDKTNEQKSKKRSRESEVDAKQDRPQKRTRRADSEVTEAVQGSSPLAAAERHGYGPVIAAKETTGQSKSGKGQEGSIAGYKDAYNIQGTLLAAAERHEYGAGLATKETIGQSKSGNEKERSIAGYEDVEVTKSVQNSSPPAAVETRHEYGAVLVTKETVGQSKSARKEGSIAGYEDAEDKKRSSLLRRLQQENIPNGLRKRYDLSLEQFRMLKSPSWVEMRSRGFWSPIQPQAARCFYRLEDGELRQIFNGDHDKEALVRHTWTLEDELMVRLMTDAEVNLWSKAKIQYGLPAPEILPNPLFCKATGPIQVEHPVLHTSGHLENQNWDEAFCALLCQLLCCDAFSKDLDFLKYVLECTLHFRKRNHTPKPNMSKLAKALALDQFDAFPTINQFLYAKGHPGIPSQLSEGFNELVNKIVSKKMEPLMQSREHLRLDFVHPHMDFIEDLEKEVDKRILPYTYGLISTDITNIIEAWDNRYIWRPGKLGVLKSMGEYQVGDSTKSRYSDGNGQRVSAESVRREKRTWILTSRMRFLDGMEADAAQEQLEREQYEECKYDGSSAESDSDEVEIIL